jgi:negative regulator of sigma-B (phosphoserine phosphatase)
VIDVAHLSLPMLGELANGDRAVSRVDAEGRALFGVVDGLGHGVDAAAAAQKAADCLESVSLDVSLWDVMQTVHERLVGSRGAAATICLLRRGEIEVCAVGNVEVRSPDLRLPLVFSPGILGVRVAKLHACRAAVSSRARFVLFSDGISSRVPVEDVRGLAPRSACEALMQRYRRKEDDATVLVADAG